MELTLDLSKQALKILTYLQENLRLGICFQERCRCKVYPCDLIKNEIDHKCFPTWVLQDRSFSNFGQFFARYPWHSFSNKVAGLQSTVKVLNFAGIKFRDFRDFWPFSRRFIPARSLQNQIPAKLNTYWVWDSLFLIFDESTILIPAYCISLLQQN